MAASSVGPGDPPGNPGVDAPTVRRARPTRFHLVSAVVLLVGLLATAGLSSAAYVVHDRNENRLLRQRVHAAADSLTKQLPGLEVGLSSAGELEQITGPNGTVFHIVFSRITGAKGPFSSAAVWDLSGAQPKQVSVVGEPQELAAQPPSVIRAFLDHSTHVPLAIISLLRSNPPMVGYAAAAPGPEARYVVYAETPLPADRWKVTQPNIAFDDLAYAAYLGPTEDSTQVLAASTRALPLKGRRASARVDYGDTSILLVVSPTRDLGGRLLQILPWLILAVGALITIGFTALAERLLRRQDHAEGLAEENARLYAAQRTVVQTLQESLLPEDLPRVDGVRFAARYEPGVDGIEIGGDWYDVWRLDDDHVVFVVGDVSGRGLRAATIQGSLRYSIRAYAAQGDDPAAILAKLNRLLSIERDEHFATIVCGEIDLVHRTLTVADAGHPPPLLIDAEGSRFVEVHTGPPIGVLGDSEYETHTIVIPESATVIAFTDGLFERRGESITVGLERLRTATGRSDLPLEQLLSHTFAELVGNGSADDIAMLGVHWET